MQFLSLFTPAVASSGPPDTEHMAKMGKLMEDMTKAGVLVTTGGILSRNTGMKIARNNGTFTVEDGPVAGSSLIPAAATHCCAPTRAKNWLNTSRPSSTLRAMAGAKSSR